MRGEVVNPEITDTHSGLKSHTNVVSGHSRPVQRKVDVGSDEGGGVHRRRYRVPGRPRRANPYCEGAKYRAQWPHAIETSLPLLKKRARTGPLARFRKARARRPCPCRRLAHRHPQNSLPCTRQNFPRQAFERHRARANLEPNPQRQVHALTVTLSPGRLCHAHRRSASIPHRMRPSAGPVSLTPQPRRWCPYCCCQHCARPSSHRTGLEICLRHCAGPASHCLHPPLPHRSPSASCRRPSCVGKRSCADQSSGDANTCQSAADMGPALRARARHHQGHVGERERPAARRATCRRRAALGRETTR